MGIKPYIGAPKGTEEPLIMEGDLEELMEVNNKIRDLEIILPEGGPTYESEVRIGKLLELGFPCLLA